MKESGRSAFASRPMGAVSTLSRGTSSERGARISASTFSNRSLGRSFGPTRAFSTKDFVFSSPKSESTQPSKINLGNLREFTIPGMAIPKESSAAEPGMTTSPEAIIKPFAAPENARRHHRRRPNRPSRAHSEIHRPDIPRIEPSNNPVDMKVEFPTLEKPRTTTSIRLSRKPSVGESAFISLRDIAVKRNRMASVSETPSVAKMENAETHALEAVLAEQYVSSRVVSSIQEARAKVERLIELKSAPEATEDVKIDAQIITAEAMNIDTRMPAPSVVPQLETIHTVMPALTTTHAVDQASVARRLFAVPRLKQFKLTTEEEVDIDEEKTRVLSSISTKAEKTKTIERTKNKVVEMILTRLEKKNAVKTTNESQKKKFKKIKYVVDNSTNKARLDVIGKIRKFVVKSSETRDQKPTWSEVVNLLPKKPDKQLISELVRGFQDNDGSWSDVKDTLKESGDIFPHAKIDPIVRSIPAVKASEHAIEEVTERDVNRVLGRDTYREAA
ncbi:MAG TPA: hypothetical protein VM077_06200 [Candidatus Limnocylindrales bacterium]|nr:hypothetical protein [Candidatus Limnocylindrales bacterium]